MDVLGKQSGRKFNLTQNNFLTQGGEAKVYKVGKTAVKVYTNPKATIKSDKLIELQEISRPNIIIPTELVYKGKMPVGYHMPFIANTYPLCQLFAKAFIQRNSITPEQLTILVRKMQETVAFIHAHKILIVDLNEVNVLVNKKFDIPYFIDTDSYQTPKFPATAIMNSISDKHTKGFTPGTDWFAWAIITFQLLVGIHPYKGKHPKIKTVDERMQSNISVFNKQVRMPKVCNPLDSIPQALRAWYYDVFEGGDRTAPPEQYSNLLLTTGHTKFNYDFLSTLDATKVVSCDWEVLDYIKINSNKYCIRASQGLYISTGKTKKYQKTKTDYKTIVHDNIIIAATIQKNKLALYNASSKRRLKHDPICAEDILVYDNNLYIKYEESIYLINFIGKYPHYIVSFTPATQVMANSSRIFPGVVIQDIGGAIHAAVFPKPGITHQYELDQLKHYKIINAKYERDILVVVGFKNKKYDRFIFRLEEGQISITRKNKDVNYNGINFAVLDSGAFILINENEDMEVCHVDSISKIKIMKDEYINGGMRLISMGDKLYFADKKEVYKLTMKGKPNG